MTGRKRRVLMVIPNQSWGKNVKWSIHPYGVCLLIAMIKERYEAALLDANIDNLSVEETEAKIADFGPDIVGVSVLSDSYRDSGFMACEAAKRVNPAIVTVMGGVFVTTRPEKAMSCPHVDYGIIGEGEYVFPQLISCLVGETSSLPEEGIVFRNGENLEIRRQKHFVNDLDVLPFPDYSVLDFSKYSMDFRKEVNAPRALPYGKIFSSRGCPIGCVFCEVRYISGNKVRAMSPERVVSEIQFLIENYGIRSIEFLDDQLIGSVRRFKKLLHLFVEKNWDLVWNAHNVSVFRLNEEILDLLKASKCQFVSLAVESGSPRVLKEIIHKPVDIEHSKRMADYCRKIKIDTCGLFVIGFPGETWDEIRQTIKLAEDIGTDYVKINIATPFPGTKLYDLAISTDSIVPSVDFDDVEWGKPVISTDEFTPDQLAILRAMEWERINFATPEKRKTLARMMRVTLNELDEIRRKTINLILA